MGKMTEKQRRFADEYIRLGEVTKAAINAGYSTKTAYSIGEENLRKPIIKSYIKKRLDELKKKAIADQDEVLQYLTSVMRGEQTEQVLRGIGMGEQTIDNMEVDSNKRIKAAELLGKRYAIWTDKHQVEDVTPSFIEDVPDED